VTLSEECAAELPVPHPDGISVVSFIWRVTDDADFKLAATGSAAIEIKWLEVFVGAAGPETVPGAKIDWDESCLLVWEESRLCTGSVMGGCCTATL